MVECVYGSSGLRDGMRRSRYRKQVVLERVAESRHGASAYFVVKRAIDTVLLCSEDIRLETRSIVSTERQVSRDNNALNERP